MSKIPTKWKTQIQKTKIIKKSGFWKEYIKKLRDKENHLNTLRLKEKRYKRKGSSISRSEVVRCLVAQHRYKKKWANR